MILRLVLLATLLCTALHTVCAQSIDSGKESDIRSLIEITGAAALGDQVADQMITNLEPFFERAFPDVPPELMAEMMSEFRVEMKGIDFAEAAVPIYARRLTAEEVQGLLEFYSSPLGQSIIAKMPAIMQESMEIGKALGEEAGLRAAERVVEQLQQKGYEPVIRM